MSSKVIFNTIILYGRMVITVGITLFTTRFVLAGLGASDFGIFNLIAGVIAMLSFISNAMATTTQRFLSYYQGKEDVIMQKKVFSNSLLIHLFIGVIVFFLLQIISIYIFDNFLNIPYERIEAAKLVYLFTSFSIFFTVVGGPYEGSLIAHENMLMVAVINILESVSKLAVALLILNVVTYDRLVLYGLSMAIISFLLYIVRVIYCKFKYSEIIIFPKLEIDKALTTKLTSFTGWNLLGALCALGKTQGLAILLNLFYGSRMNASYGIANQVSGQLNFFSNTLLRAINPQIMRNEGKGNRSEMIDLTFSASKYGFILLAIFAIPSIFKMETLLNLWLKQVPENSVSLCILILFALMVNQITVGIDSGVQAVGNLKRYMLIVGLTKLLIVPVGYILLSFSFDYMAIFFTYILLEALGGILRIFLAKELFGMKIIDYFKKVLLPLMLPITITICVNFVSQYQGNFNIIIFYLISVGSTLVSFYYFGLQKSEKLYLLDLGEKLFNKLRK